MSAVIKTTTPFVIEEVLMEALVAVGAEPVRITSANLNTVTHQGRLVIGDILTNRSDYYGPQHFRLEGDRWILRHDSSEMNGRVSNVLAGKHYSKVARFLDEVEVAYGKAYQGYLERAAEQERVRLEAERKVRVEATRQQAIAKAKAQGYSVKQTTNSKGQIQLVLIRTV